MGSVRGQPLGSPMICPTVAGAYRPGAPSPWCGCMRLPPWDEEPAMAETLRHAGTPRAPRARRALAVAAAVALAGAAPAAAAPPLQPVSPFDMIGFLQSAKLGGNDLLAGGT